jgi:hypothetical protein
LALGALKARASIPDALQIASEIDPYTAPPFSLYSQKKPISKKRPVK